MVSQTWQTPYQDYGTLDVDHPSYIVRKADEELYQKLQKKHICCVFNARQMGKSSLMVQVRARLKQNFICPVIDLTGIDAMDGDSWYKSIAYTLVTQVDYLSNKVNLEDFWEQQHSVSSPSLKWQNFIEQVLLAQSPEQSIIIFLDEIDRVRNLPDWANDFFSRIRFFYNQRACDEEKSKYSRLNFALFGAASPTDLIKKHNDIRQEVPFNIGKYIELDGFTFEQARNLAKGMEKKAENPEEVLREILRWTNGQPCLTQKLCVLIFESEEVITSGTEKESVENLVRHNFIKNWRSDTHNDHFTTIEKRLLEDNEWNWQRLSLYQKILEKIDNNGIKADESHAQWELRLSGVVVKKGNRLKVFNQIYREIFNLTWVEEKLAKLRPYLKKWEEIWKQSNDEKWLLQGQLLQRALQWRESVGGRLSSSESDFLNESLVAAKLADNKSKDKIQRLKEELGDKLGDFDAIINSITAWTNNQSELTQKICLSLLRDFPIEVSMSEREEWIAQWIQNQVIKQWENSLLAEHLLLIRDRLLQDKELAFFLLEFYQKIWNHGGTLDKKFRESRELLYLLYYGLVVEEQKEIKISNRIYRQVFDGEWVDQQLDSLRPYAESLKAWVASNFDESKLLSKQDLKIALEWVYSKKKVKNKEHRFLTESLILRVLGGVMSSEPLVELRSRLIKESINPYPFIQSVLEWTRNHPKLTPILGNFILDSISELHNQWPTYEQKKEAIDQFVKNSIHPKKSNYVTTYLNRIIESFQNDVDGAQFRLLLCLRQVLQGDRKYDETSKEDRILESKNLVIINPANYLKIHNPIFRDFFQKEVIENILFSLRPYAKEFVTWLDSNCQNESMFLKDQKLKEALEFTHQLEHYRKMTDKEHQFLTKSLISQNNPGC